MNEIALLATVYHEDLYGLREIKENSNIVAGKYAWLLDNFIYTTSWKSQVIDQEFFLFCENHHIFYSEYETAIKINNIFSINSTGIKSHRDHFVYDFENSKLQERIENFRNLLIGDIQIIEMYEIKDSRDWKIEKNRRLLASINHWNDYFTLCAYRPFDYRNYYNHESVVELPRQEIMQHIINH